MSGSKTKTGIELIAEERRRQVEEEGWTAENDSQYTNGQLAVAGACYALHTIADPFLTNLLWPWVVEWWKPRDRLRDLVRAGALIAAEIDRQQETMRPVINVAINGLNLDLLRDLLSLVEVNVEVDFLKGLEVDDLEAVHDWASAFFVAANDNEGVKVPQRPGCLQ